VAKGLGLTAQGKPCRQVGIPRSGPWAGPDGFQFERLFCDLRSPDTYAHTGVYRAVAAPPWWKRAAAWKV